MHTAARGRPNRAGMLFSQRRNFIIVRAVPTRARPEQRQRDLRQRGLYVKISTIDFLRSSSGACMRLTIVTIGSRGDVQPFIALGKALQARGHTVVTLRDR